MRPIPRRSGPRPRRFGAARPRLSPGLVRCLVGAAAFALLVSCGGEEAALRVDGVSFTEEDLLGLSEERRGRLAELTAVGLSFARDEIDRVGAPLVERRLEELLLERFRAALVLEGAEIGDDVLRAQYATDPRYELVVRHVVALAERQDPDSVHVSARATAEEALRRIESGEPMAEVAADLSEEPGAAERGGLLQPGREGSWVPEFWRAANSLEDGEHTGVVRTEYGYHVIQLEERRTVPFEEVRSEVVLEAGRMLGGMDDAWAAWSDSVTATVTVDTDALRAWREGAAATVDTGVVAADGSAGAGSVLARVGPEGEGAGYTAARFLAHAVSLDEDRWLELVEGPASGAEEAVRREAVRWAATRAAGERGLRVSPGEEDRLVREWRSRLAGWAVVFGFEPGAPPSAIGARARETLSTTQQNASIARDEVEPRGPLLRAAYSIRGLERETGAAAGS